MGFALTTGQVSGTLPGDLMMLAAVILCGLGYAEGVASHAASADGR